MSKYKEAERIADEARRAISDFCINECKAYCCKKGYIMVRENQLKQIATEEKIQILEKEEKIKEFPFSGKFQIDFSNSFGGCPALKDNKCTIHKNPIRPRVCHEFPIFVFAGYVKISPKCPAHQNNKLYPFIKKLKELGYEIKNEK